VIRHRIAVDLDVVLAALIGKQKTVEEEM